MKYQLISNSLNDISRPVETVLKNRGIEDWKQYLSLDGSVVQDYNDLNRLQDAVECFVRHYDNRDKMLVIIDEDADGYTSSSMLYLYIKALDEDYPIEYILHNRPKSHGLANYDYTIPEDVKLFIIADAASNDAIQCNELIKNGIDIIILDHHDSNYAEESEEEINYQTVENNNAIVVNNQLSPEYKNKDLSGAGIVYRFLQALDEELWEEHADEFLDLCAVGNIADVMDMRSLETRYFVEQGMKTFNNNFLKALFKAQEYSMRGIINVHNVAWYIAPIINSVTRMGSFEERDILFRAMTNQYDEFDYKKRDGSIVKENIYDRAARLAKNVKSRQDKQRDIVFDELKDSADLNDKVVILESKKAQSGLVGLSCMKLADTIKRPVIVVKEIEKDGRKVLSGSCRNFDGSPIPDLKDLILKTKTFEFVAGHGNAAGCGILPENLDLAKQRFDELLKDVDFDIPIQCDFILDVDDLSISFIQEVDAAQWIWGTGIKEPKVAIENISIQRKDLALQGKNFDSVAFAVNDIKYVQFKLTEGDPLYDFVNEWTGSEDDWITIDVVGECSINEYGGVYTPQVIINNCRRRE
jgi:single-stranded-DNA-specific exonuclease